MYLESLKIVETSPTNNVIRDVPFKDGLNIVVDESDDEKGNNVGKTTFLKLIDICLGASDKKYIWTDSDTGSETKNLKEYIQLKKVFAELTIKKNGTSYDLRVELFDNGRKYINGKKIPAKAYNQTLNNIIFNIEPPPSFRQLIKKFVRIKQNDNVNNATLKYLHSNTTNDRYHNIYEFLFKLDELENSAYRLELKEKINQLIASRDELFKLHQFSNIEDLTERLKLVEKRTGELQLAIDSLINQQKFKQSLDEVTKIKERLNILNDSLDGAHFKKSKIESILEKESTQDLEVDEQTLHNFYNEITKQIDDITKKFTELIEFNAQIKRNKIDFYQNRLKQINIDIEAMNSEREKIIDENQDAISLINEDNFEEYENKYESLLNESQRLGELNKVYEIYKSLTNGIDKTSKELNELNHSLGDSDNITIFNNYFAQFTEIALGQRLYIYRNTKGFPIGISNFNDGFGSGYKKTITLLLDIAYISFLNKLNLPYPRFIIHDELETIDEFNFDKIVDIIKDNGTQFVFGILSEKIEGYDFIEEKDKILKLSSTDKLFKV